MDAIDRLREAARNEATCIELSMQNKELRARVARLEEALKEIENKDSTNIRGHWSIGPFAKIAHHALEEK